MLLRMVRNPEEYVLDTLKKSKFHKDPTNTPEFISLIGGGLTRDLVVLIFQNLNIKEWIGLNGLSKNWNVYFSSIIKKCIENLPRAMHLYFPMNKAQCNHFLGSIRYQHTDQLALFKLLTYLTFKTFYQNQNYPRLIGKAFSQPRRLIRHCLVDSALAYLVLNSSPENQLPHEVLQGISKSKMALRLTKRDTGTRKDVFIFWLIAIALMYLMKGKDTTGLSFIASLFIAYCAHYARYFAIHLIKDPAPKTIKTSADEFIKKISPPKNRFLTSSSAILFYKKQTVETARFEARCLSNFRRR